MDVVDCWWIVGLISVLNREWAPEAPGCSLPEDRSGSLHKMEEDRVQKERQTRMAERMLGLLELLATRVEVWSAPPVPLQHVTGLSD
jgi:hypothetical protein